MALATLYPLEAQRAYAYPIATPAPVSSSSAHPTQADVLPFDSRLTFVLDGTLSSGSSHANDVIKAHLKDALVVGGQTIAAAGTPVEIHVVDAQPAQNPDIYGFVDIYLGPLTLGDGRFLPLRPPTAHLNVDVSAGHQSTVGVEDTIGDVFAPTLLLHVFRKGRNFTLEPGAEIHGLTEARIEVTRSGAVAITTPAPLVIEGETPHSSFPTMPIATPEDTKEVPQAPLIRPSQRPTMTPFPGTKTPPPIYQTPSPN